jgi:hypothetical protein
LEDSRRNTERFPAPHRFAPFGQCIRRKDDDAANDNSAAFAAGFLRIFHDAFAFELTADTTGI